MCGKGTDGEQHLKVTDFDYFRNLSLSSALLELGLLNHPYSLQHVNVANVRELITVIILAIIINLAIKLMQ